MNTNLILKEKRFAIFSDTAIDDVRYVYHKIQKHKLSKKYLASCSITLNKTDIRVDFKYDDFILNHVVRLVNDKILLCVYYRKYVFEDPIVNKYEFHDIKKLKKQIYDSTISQAKLMYKNIKEINK